MDEVAASLGAKVLTTSAERPPLWTENIEPADENVGGGGSALAVAADSGVSLAWDLDKVREWALGAVALKPAPIPESGGAEVYYYHTDHLGTPRALTDETQGVVWRADMTPFGTVLETVNQVANPLRFPGQYFDPETGLHYNYFRDYDPGIGRYTQSDPIGVAGGLNSYLYANANPPRFTDLLGLAPCDGQWKRVRWVRDPFSAFTFKCTCYWSCFSCLGSGTGDTFPIPNLGQFSTKGTIFFNPGRSGKDFDPEAGNDCLCSAPGPERGCDNCDQE